MRGRLLTCILSTSAQHCSHKKIRVDAYLKEYETRLRIDYVITDCATGKKLTKATTIQVAVDIEKKEMQFVSPPVLHEKLQKVI